MSQVLPRPQEHDSAIWVDEAIWGHRLYDEQTPWLTVLEFLGVLYAEAKAGRALIEARPNSLSYKPQQQLRLRNVLFNNPHLASVLMEGSTDERAWTTWYDRMGRHAAGLRDGAADFHYLRERFRSFQDFTAVVHFLRTTALESNSNKRWSSKFVFPFGPSAFYEDLTVSDTSVSNDRRFFGRTGEVLYLMLCRSGRAEELVEQLTKRFLDETTAYNRLVRAIQGTDQLAPNDRPGVYLPYPALSEFTRLADDWLAILRRSLPAYDALPHLVTITGLNIILYQLSRARDILGREGHPTMVVEIVSPKRTVLRELSAVSYDANNILPRQAVERFVRRVTETEEWRTALASGDPRGEARTVLQRHFDWPDPKQDDERELETEQLVEELVKQARERHLQHAGNIHGAWGRAIGLASRRASRKVRYAPTDGLLKTLVVCSVDGRMPFKEFLAYLYRRYGFVIGDQQAGDYIGSGQADQAAFSDNARRLEDRLFSLGLVRRLSDSCAYVENPFYSEASRGPA